MTKTILAVSLFFVLRPQANEGGHGGGAETHAAVHVEEEIDPDSYVIDVRDTPGDFKVPTKLWDLILGKDSRKEKDEPLIVWLPVKVFFNSKSAGIFHHEKIIYNLPRGGGTIDLAKNAEGDRGTFFLKFGLNEFSNPNGMKVFFLSNAKKKRIDNEIYGAGCNVYFDVTSSLLKAQTASGMKFNITDARHVSSMGGHFLFVQLEKDKVFLSQVEFTDSKNREQLCKI